MWQEECGSLDDDVCPCIWRPAANILGVMVYLCVYLGECQLQRTSAAREAFWWVLPRDVRLQSKVGRFHRVGDSNPGQCVGESVPCKAFKNLQHVVVSAVLQWHLSNCCNAITAQAQKNKGVQTTNKGTYHISSDYNLVKACLKLF